MRLKNVMTMKLGLNLSRQKDKEDIPIYTNKDMLDDLEQIDEGEVQETTTSFEDGIHTVHEGDVVYNFINSICGMVSVKHDGKKINQNFAKIDFDNNQLDGKFLCYLLNESPEIEKQKFMSLQGSIVKKLSPSMIHAFEVTLPAIDTQKQIGALYFDWLKHQALSRKEQELEDKLVKQMLNDLSMMKE